MLFNSLEFAVFLPLVFVIYWLLPAQNLQLRNAFLLVASCVFYMAFIPAYILSLFVTILIDYVAGLYMNRFEGRPRKFLLVGSIVATCLVLFVFKYFEFFITNFVNFMGFWGVSVDSPTLRIILPIGLSFHTFQSLSYVVEVYRGHQRPERNLITYATYVMFFPQLVAGPIERPQNLLVQFNEPRTFSYPLAVDGLRRVLWGFFKKVVIADNCAEYVNPVFAAPEAFGGGELWLAVMLFSFQIYGDFSGYSDIACGTANLCGFKLMTNFRFPYFSRDIAEFWRRWHVSLSTWFRDYVYIPLGGSKGSQWLRIRNVFVVFLLSGFWHGANWTFVIWGALHALFFLPLLLAGLNRTHVDAVAGQRMVPSLRETALMIITFVAVSFAWIFFRAASLHEAAGYISRAFTDWTLGSAGLPKTLLVLIFVMLLFEWLNRHKDHPLQEARLPKWMRWSGYYALLLIIYLYGNFHSQYEFIYFQF